MKIAVYEIEDWERDAFQGLGDGREFAFSVKPLTARTAEEHPEAKVVSTFINSDLGNHVLEKFPDLEMIATRSTGFDHIDLGYCRDRDIAVANVPEYGDNTVAEHVFGLLLTISHNLHESIDRTRKGDFSLRGLQGFDLMGRTMGVVGTGSIGLKVVKIAKGFGMEVLAFDVKPDEDAARECGFAYKSLDELMSGSDVITLHVPYNDKTKPMISHEQFEKMKPGTVLINTSRGAVVDIQALLRALADGRVRAAGLDVLPEEPVIREEAELLRSVFQKKHNLEDLLADHILLRMRNVYITPHSAFNTKEAVRRILDTTRDNIEAYLGGKPENLVT